MTRSVMMRKRAAYRVAAGLVSIVLAAPPAAASFEFQPGAHFDEAALARAMRSTATEQPPAASNTCDCRNASVAEKLAWLYLLIGGSILLAYGPTEKSGSRWTSDGKSETAAGAGAIVLSFALLRDIRRKAHAQAHR